MKDLGGKKGAVPSASHLEAPPQLPTHITPWVPYSADRGSLCTPPEDEEPLQPRMWRPLQLPPCSHPTQLSSDPHPPDLPVPTTRGQQARGVGWEPGESTQTYRQTGLFLQGLNQPHRTSLTLPVPSSMFTVVFTQNYCSPRCTWATTWEMHEKYAYDRSKASPLPQQNLSPDAWYTLSQLPTVRKWV